MRAGMVVTSENERVHWMNLMKAGMVMIGIRNGCRRGQRILALSSNRYNMQPGWTIIKGKQMLGGNAIKFHRCTLQC